MENARKQPRALCSLKYGLPVLGMALAVFCGSGCRAKSCPAYGDDALEKRGLFHKKKKTKNGLFTRKQRQFYR